MRKIILPIRDKPYNCYCKNCDLELLVDNVTGHLCSTSHEMRTKTKHKVDLEELVSAIEKSKIKNKEKKAIKSVREEEENS